MSKKLLSEAQVRRFAKLANLSPINEMDYKRDEDTVEEGTHKGDELNTSGPGRGEKKGDKAYINEDAFEDEAEMGAEAGMDELPEPEEAELDDMAGDDVDLGSREQMAKDVILAVSDALNIEVDIEGGEEEMEMDAEVSMDDGGEEMEMDAEEEIMEALKGINYVPSQQEVVNEVAKRVARRLLEAKKADAKLQEALGNKRRRRVSRRRK